MHATLLLVAALQLNPNCPYVCKLEPDLGVLEARLRLAQSQLEACPANQITRCINPAKRKIEALSNFIDALQKEGK